MNMNSYSNVRWFSLVILAALVQLVHAWESTHPSENVSLAATETYFGGTFVRSSGFHYAGDTRIGGRLTRNDRLISFGRFALSANAGFDGEINLGHFESYGADPAFTDFVGLQLAGDGRGGFVGRPSIRFSGGAVRQGPAFAVPAGEHEWNYEYDPLGGFGFGGLRVFLKAGGVVTAESELQLGPDAAALTFACNAFGLHTGYATAPAPHTAQVFATQAEYTTIPVPDGRRPGARVFLLIGESNARGQDSAYQGNSPGARSENVYVYTDQWSFAQVPSEPRNQFGPELALGRELARIYGGQIAIIKVTAPSGTLGDWLPGQGGYSRLISATRQALGELRAPHLSGVFAVQGESDSRSAACAQRYAQNLQALNAALRREFRAPNLPLIVSRLMPFIQAPYRNQVRAAQETLPWVNTDDLSHIGDGLHYDGASLNRIGERFAAKFAQTARAAR